MTFAGVDLVLVVVEVDAVADNGLLGGRGHRVRLRLRRRRIPAYVQELVVCLVADVLWLVEAARRRGHEQRRRTLAVALHIVGEYLYLVGRARLQLAKRELQALGVRYLFLVHLLLLVATAAGSHLVVVDLVALDVAGRGRIVATRRSPFELDRVVRDS